MFLSLLMCAAEFNPNLIKVPKKLFITILFPQVWHAYFFICKIYQHMVEREIKYDTP